MSSPFYGSSQPHLLSGFQADTCPFRCARVGMNPITKNPNNSNSYKMITNLILIYCRQSFQYLVFVVAVVSTFLAFLQPAFNAFALMTLGVPTLVLMISELSRCDNSRVLRLGTRCGAVWILAVACWVNDKLFCETWSNLNFPYLHAFWHVLIFIASYTACVLFAYFDAKNQVKFILFAKI